DPEDTGANVLVTPAEAARVADRLIAAAPNTGPDHLRTILDEAESAVESDAGDAAAIFLNAIDAPGGIAGRTAPFTYESGGVYTIEATGIVNNPAGVELARHVLRETVAVAPPREVTLHIDSQED